VAKRDRIGKPKPGSIRYDSRERGVTEAFIRKERALARGYNPKTLGRGHHGPGEHGIMLKEGIVKYHSMTPRAQKAFEKLLKKTAKDENMTMHQLWTALLNSPAK
jgi:hypothetical protein